MINLNFDKDGPFIVRSAIIGTGLVGFVVFARSMRLFTTFQHCRQIPDEFFKKQMRLRGTVAFVTSDGILRVRHEPLVKIPFVKYFSKQKDVDKLSVRVAGINLTENGREWMKKHVLLKPVLFNLVKKELPDTLVCDVYLKKGIFFTQNLNRELVRSGLGSVPPLDDRSHVTAFQVNPAYARLTHDLLICERYADRRGAGLWRQPSAIRRWLEIFHGWRLGVSDIWRRLSQEFLKIMQIVARGATITAQLAKTGGAKAITVGKQRMS